MFQNTEGLQANPTTSELQHVSHEGQEEVTVEGGFHWTMPKREYESQKANEVIHKFVLRLIPEMQKTSA